MQRHCQPTGRLSMYSIVTFRNRTRTILLTDGTKMGSTLAYSGFNDEFTATITGLPLSGIHMNTKHAGLENTINIGTTSCNRIP